MNAVLKFLQSLRSLYNQGAIKSVDEAMDFAKNEFGEITEFLDAQIKNVFKKSPEKKSKGIMDAEIIEASFKPGKSKYSDKIIEESPSQRQVDLDRPFVTEEEMAAFTLEDNARKLNKAKGYIDKLGAKTDKQKLFVADLVENASEGIFKNVDMGAVVRSNMYDDLIEQGVDEDTLMNIMYLGTRSDDFGTTLAKIRSNAMDEGIDMDETLDFYGRVFDEVSRIKKSMGGRISYAFGSGLKLIKLLGGKKKLDKAIKEAVDDLNPTGDPKLDADMAVDNMLETYNIDRDAVDQYDIIDAYGKAYDELKLPIVNQLKNKRKPSVDEEQYYNVRNSVFDEVDAELEKQFPGVTEQMEALTKQSSASIKRDTIARRLGLDPFKLNEQQKMVLDKYGNKIDDDLLKNILIDDDPQRIAEVTATIDEAFIMQDKGMGADEILETVKNTTRTKQADGTSEEGLSVMTELLQKAKIKKQKDANDNKQVRFRKLLASNKFPELNEFFEAQLDEDGEKEQLTMRMFGQAGGPFTTQQLGQRKQQSYLDYLARQGVVGPSAGTGTTGTGTTGTGTTGVSVFTSPTSPAPSTGTGGTSTTGTSGGTGGTSGGGTTSPGPASPGTVSTGSGGMTSGGGSSGGSSTGSSGGATSSGGSNVYTGSGNLPPSMQTGSSTGSGSSLTPNTGNVNVGGGGFGGTGSIVGGGTGSTGTTSSTGTNNQVDTGDLGSEAANVAANQAATNTGTTVDQGIQNYLNKEMPSTGLPESNTATYQSELSNAKSGANSNISAGVNAGGVFVDPTTGKTYISHQYSNEANPGYIIKNGERYGRTRAEGYIPPDEFFGFSDGSSVTHEFVEQSVIDSLRDQYGSNTGSGQVDTGDLGSEAANVAASSGNIPDWRYLDTEQYGRRYRMTPDEYKKVQNEFYGDDPTKKGFDEYFKNRFGADGPTFVGEEQMGKYKDQSATADDGFEVFTDSAGNKRITQDQYNQAKLEFLKSEGKISQDATVNDLGQQEGGPRNTSLNEAAKEYIENKYGTSSTLSPNAKTAYQQMGGGADFAQITSLPETSQIAQSIQGETNDKNILQKANEFATKHGKTITAASYLLDAVVPGAGKAIRTAQAVNKGYNLVTGARDAAMNDVLTKPTGIGGQVDLNETLSKGTTPEPEYDGNIGSIFFSDGGRVGFRYGGDDARIKKYMKPSYDDPFSKLSNVDKKRYDAFNRLVLNKGRKMISTDKKKKRNLLTLNEQARAKALQRLNLLKKLYGRG